MLKLKTWLTFAAASAGIGFLGCLLGSVFGPHTGGSQNVVATLFGILCMGGIGVGIAALIG